MKSPPPSQLHRDQTPPPVPVLARLLFGPGAEAGWRSAGQAFIAWANCFERYLEARAALSAQRKHTSISIWRRALAFMNKAPAEITGTDLWRWIDALRAEGRTPSTLGANLAELRRFYKFAIQEGLAETDPTGNVYLKSRVSYANAVWLCQAEVEALLGSVDREENLVGKRDYALMLWMFLSGQHLKTLRQVQWTAGPHRPPLAPSSVQDPPFWLFQRDGAGWVDWPRGAQRRLERVEDQAWGAILDYLQASGRWENLGEGDYIFAPLKKGLDFSAAPRHADWDAQRPLSSTRLANILKRYLRWSALAVDRFLVTDARHTAVMLRVSSFRAEGAGEQEIARWVKDWLGWKRSSRALSYIRKLSKTPVTERRLAAVERAWKKGPRRSPSGAAPLLRPRSQVFTTGTGALAGDSAKTLAPAGGALPLVDGPELPLQSSQDIDKAIATFQTIITRALRLAMQTDDYEVCSRQAEIYGKSFDRLLKMRKLARELEHLESQETIAEAITRAQEEILGKDWPGSGGEKTS